MGWKPNAFASAYMAQLRTQRPPGYQATLAFLTAHPTSPHIKDLPGHVVRHFNGATQQAAKAGYALSPIWLHEPGMTGRRLNGILRSRNIHGIIISHLLKPTHVFDDFDWSEVAPVALGFSLSKPDLDRVAVRSTQGFDLVLRQALTMGYRKIAVVVSYDYDRRQDHGLLFPTSFAQLHWQPAGTIQSFCFPQAEPSVIPEIQAWLRKNRPQIVLGEGILLEAIRDMGWRIPEDVAYMSVDRGPEYPHIAGLNQRHELHGVVATDLVVGQLLQNRRGLPEVPRCVSVQACWAPGDTAPSLV